MVGYKDERQAVRDVGLEWSSVLDTITTAFRNYNTAVGTAKLHQQGQWISFDQPQEGHGMKKN